MLTVTRGVEGGSDCGFSHQKLYHVRPVELRHGLWDEYAQFAWEEHLGLSASSTVAPPQYTLIARRAMSVRGSFWKWEYRRRELNGAESHWMSEEDGFDSFTPLQPPCSTRFGSCVTTQHRGLDRPCHRHACSTTCLAEHVPYARFWSVLW